MTPGGARARRILWTALACVLFAGFSALGTWQLMRLQWKTALIERVQARVHAAPVSAPGPDEWAGIHAQRHEYLRVKLAGKFQHRLATPVQAVTALGPGFWVITPLTLNDGSTVLVNRGYVARFALEASSDARVEVTGLLRITEPAGGFLRTNDPVNNRWYSRDVAAIAKARGLGGVAPYFVDAERDPAAAKDAPVGGLTVIAFHNSHLVYALTWYALAAMVAGAYFWIRRQPRPE